MVYTVGGNLLTIPPAPAYTPTPDTGTLGSGQAYSAFLPDTPTGYPGIIFSHTAGGSQTVINAAFIEPVARYLASQGFACVAGEEGGTESWGNDASRTDVDELVDYLSDEGAGDQVGFVGYSMGLVTDLSWVSNGHLADTFAVTSVAGCASMQQVHDDDPVLAASMDAAYGSEANWSAALSERDPLELAEAGEFAGLPICQWVGALDVISTVASAELLAAEVATATVIEGPYDHLGTVVYAGQMAIASYLMGKYPPTARARSLVV